MELREGGRPIHGAAVARAEQRPSLTATGDELAVTVSQALQQLNPVNALCSGCAKSRAIRKRSLRRFLTYLWARSNPDSLRRAKR